MSIGDFFVLSVLTLLSVGMLRKATKDFTFSNGVFIPEGTLLVSNVLAIQNDSAIFEDPHLFNPWRFSDARERETDSSKHDFTSTSNEMHTFGHGRHAW